MKRMKDLITQIRTWAVRLTALRERRHLYPIADEMKKEADRLEEGGYLIVSDLDTFEKCGLFDAEAQKIIDSDNLAFATDEDLGRKDEDGGVWTLAWVRVATERETHQARPLFFLSKKTGRWESTDPDAQEWVSIAQENPATRHLWALVGLPAVLTAWDERQ